MRSMVTRLVILALIAVLALPATTMPRPAESNHSPWSDVIVVAKGKKHKMGKK